MKGTRARKLLQLCSNIQDNDNSSQSEPRLPHRPKCDNKINEPQLKILDGTLSNLPELPPPIVHVDPETNLSELQLLLLPTKPPDPQNNRSEFQPLLLSTAQPKTKANFSETQPLLVPTEQSNAGDLSSEPQPFVLPTVQPNPGECFLEPQPPLLLLNTQSDPEVRLSEPQPLLLTTVQPKPGEISSESQPLVLSIGELDPSINLSKIKPLLLPTTHPDTGAHLSEFQLPNAQPDQEANLLESQPLLLSVTPFDLETKLSEYQLILLPCTQPDTETNTSELQPLQLLSAHPDPERNLSELQPVLLLNAERNRESNLLEPQPPIPPTTKPDCAENLTELQPVLLLNAQRNRESKLLEPQPPISPITKPDCAENLSELQPDLSPTLQPDTEINNLELQPLLRTTQLDPETNVHNTLIPYLLHVTQPNTELQVHQPPLHHSPDVDSDYRPDESSDTSTSIDSISATETLATSQQNDKIADLARASPEETLRDVTNNGVDFGNMSEGRKRKKKAEPYSWKKNLNKRLRLEGKPYLGYEAPKGEKMKHNKDRPGRKLGNRCNSNFCKNSAMRFCEEISEDARKDIFNTFWNTMDWAQRKVYVSNNVIRVGKKRATVSAAETSRRAGTLKYYLPVTKSDGTTEKKPVCRNMFLSTLCLGSFTVQSWVKKSFSGMLPSAETESRNRKNVQTEEVKTQLANIHEFFESLPKLPSHYNRKDTNKLFIEPVFRNLAHLYEVYTQFCEEKNNKAFSRKKFNQVYHDKNLAIHKLKKDMCDTCVGYETGNVEEVLYRDHIIKKERARLEKENDKKAALENKCIVLNVDLQAVKVCPFITASAVYFKTKLALHNYSVYNVTSHQATCYWFCETESDLTSSTFASLLTDYLQRHCVPNDLPIIIYSDGCTSQNRNNILSNALLNFAICNNVSITQKYLEVGHTQMEGDSVHSCIERKLKNRSIHLPSDYVTATKEARPKFPYETIMVKHNLIKNYGDCQTWRYTAIRPGRKPGDPKVTDIKVISYYTDGTIKVKLDYDSDWLDLPSRPKRIPPIIEYKPLHSHQIPIKASKFKHLQELKSVLPTDCHTYYDTIPYTNE